MRRTRNENSIPDPYLKTGENDESNDHWHAKALSPKQTQRYFPKEVPATAQLYLDGKMEQFWLRDKEAGVIFLMTVNSVEGADKLLKSLPLGQANLLTFDLMPVGPLLPLGMLMKANTQTAVA